MRFLNKYKLYSRRTAVVAKTPVRVLYFKRSKWQKLKTQFCRINRRLFKKRLSRINNKSKLRVRFQLIKKNLAVNTNTLEDTKKFEFSRLNTEKKLKRFAPSLVKSRFEYHQKSLKLQFRLIERKKQWKWWKRRRRYLKRRIYDTHLIGVGKRRPPKIKKKYLDQLNRKRRLSSFFDNAIKFKKCSYTSREIVQGHVLLKPLYRIDILLWYLKYYGSTCEAKQNINNKNIFVNDVSVRPNYFVKEGDIISFNFTSEWERKNTHRNIRKKFVKNKNFLSFLEYDKYTNTIIILKDIHFLTYEDYNLFVTETAQLKKYYINNLIILYMVVNLRI